MYVDLTGYKIYVGSKKDLVLKLQKYLIDQECFDKLNIVSGNPEVLLNGIENKELNEFFKREDSLIIPDGVGVIVLLKIFKKYVTEKGKIIPSRQTGTCSRHQRELTVAIKRARNMALLPFSGD